MKVLILGAGRMGSAAAWDLARQPGIDSVFLVDRDEWRLNKAAREIKDSLSLIYNEHAAILTAQVDLEDEFTISYLMEGVDVVLSSADYSLNERLTKWAINTKTHMCDLGGNLFVVENQIELSKEAEEQGVTVIPDCGLAPGMAGLFAAYGIERFANVESVKMRVGGLPAHPLPPLNYKLVFSVRGLINEYLEPTEVLRNGKILMAKPLRGVEELEFPTPFGKMEAFNTSGGSSTLPKTFKGRVKNLDYKTIRYPGHAAIFAGMEHLGLLSSRPVGAITPRIFTEQLLENTLTNDDTDVVLMRVEVTGTDENGKSGTVGFEMIDYYDEETGHSAMARTTAYSAATVAYMLATGEIEKRGVLPGEIAVPLESFAKGIKERGLTVREYQSWQEN